MKKIHEYRKEEYTGLYSKFSHQIDEILVGLPNHLATLEELCSQEVSPAQLSRLKKIHDKVGNAFDIPRHFDSYDDVLYNFAPLKEKEALEQIVQLESAYNLTLECIQTGIYKEWKDHKKKFQTWQEKYGLEELQNLRLDLNAYSELYHEIQDLHIPSTRLREIEEIEQYNRFLLNIKPINSDFERLKERYTRCKRLSNKELNVLMRDFESLEKKYKIASKIQAPLQRLFIRNSIFECKESFIEIDEYKSKLENLIAYKSQPRKQEAEQSLELPAAATLNLENKIEETIKPINSMNESSLTPTETEEPPIYTPPTLSEKRPSRIEYTPIIRNQTHRFDMFIYLKVIGFPPSRYMGLMDILLGKTGIQHKIERLTSFTEQLEELPPANSVSEMDYLYHLEHALREDMNHGNIDPLIANNPQYWEEAHSALTKLGEYIQCSEASLGMDALKIQAHLPVSGPENPYNKMLA